MERNTPYNADSETSDYDRLVAEYRETAARCQACLDQLAAAERELRSSARQNGHAAHVSREIDVVQLDLLQDERSHLLAGISRLSAREREVFVLIGEGVTTQEISEKLTLATSTVETYRERLKTKLKLKSGHALVRQAVLWSANRECVY